MIKRFQNILILSLISLLFIGCGSTKVVFVDTQANLVRLGPDVSGKVYVQKMESGFFLKQSKASRGLVCWRIAN